MPARTPSPEPPTGSGPAVFTGRSLAPGSRLRIIVTGYILRLPLGGNAWPYLSYVMVLRKMGHEAYYFEESGDSPYCCYDPETGDSSRNADYGLRFTADTFESVGLGDCWAYHDAHADRWHGPCANRAAGICASADLLLRMPAMADGLSRWFREIPVRALVDLDPVFTQLRHLDDPAAMRDAANYTAWFSFGENIGRGTSQVPDDGLPWQATRPPIDLDAWTATPGRPGGMFSTVMKWESYRSIEHEGVRYGMKADAFAPYMDLPRKTPARLALVASGGNTPAAELKRMGWTLGNPLKITRDLWTYQRYISESKGEFSVAKLGYVVSRSGWLSDRSGAYLASGRPVLVQDTGLADWIETGAGFLAFSNPEEALAGLDEINSRYAFHCRAAREVAEEYFDARKILSRLLERAFDPQPPGRAGANAASPPG